jgi:hypothetical protein
LIASGVAGGDGNDATHIDLHGLSAVNDFYNGCLVYLKDHTGAAQVRMITDYVGSTALATVAPAFATAPDNTTDYEVYLTDVAITTLIANNLIQIGGTAQTAGDVVADVVATHAHAVAAYDEAVLVHAHAATIEADVALVHTHVGTIDGRITADYGATEKAAIDLLDDAAGGLMDIHTDVGTVASDVAAVHVHAGTIDTGVAAIHVHVDDIHDTDLPAVKADTADLHTDVGTVITNVGDLHTDVGTAITAIGDVHATDLPAVMTMLTDIHGTDLPAVKADTAAILLDTGTDGVLLTSAVIHDISDHTWDEARADHVTAGTFGEISTTASVVDAIFDEAAADHVAAGSMGKAIADILVDTAVIGALGVGLTAIPWNAAWDAEVQSEVDDALKALELDHLFVTDYDPTAKPGLATALLNELIGNDVGVSQFTANALELSPSGLSAAAIAAGVWGDAIPGAYGAGTAGAHLEAAGAAADPWATDLPGAYAGTTAGHIIGHIGAPVGASISEDLAAVKAQTDDLHTDLGTVATDVAAVHVHAGTIETDVAAVHVHVADIHDTDLPAVKADTAAILTDTGTTLDASIAAILADTAELETDWHNGGRLDLLLDAATAPSAATVATAVWAEVLEGTLTAKVFQRIMLSVLSGASADHNLGAPKFKSVNGATTRATATVDADGNRTAVTLNGT